MLQQLQSQVVIPPGEAACSCHEVSQGSRVCSSGIQQRCMSARTSSKPHCATFVILCQSITRCMWDLAQDAADVPLQVELSNIGLAVGLLHMVAKCCLQSP